MTAMTASTPCRQLCDLDPETALCRGCGRTLAEIAGWAGMTEAARRTVMAALAVRLARAYPAAAGDRHRVRTIQP